MWVRGLKHDNVKHRSTAELSHPMWVRGLKLASSLTVLCECSVAPHVGAWIETKWRPYQVTIQQSHPMWVRGLKPH